MKKERTNNIKVVKNKENPETPSVLAEAIIKIGDSMKILSSQGSLSNDAIAALICNMRGNSQLAKGDVMLVLDGLNRLKSYYIKG